MPEATTSPTRSPPSLWLLSVWVLAVALVPDEAVLRSKVVWAEGLMVAVAGVLLLESARAASLSLPWPPVLLAGLLPGLVALAGTLRSDLIGRALATDEVVRLLLLPLAIWATAAALARRDRRGVFAGLLATGVALAAGLAVAQNLADVLHLPLNRAERPTSTFGNPVFLGAFLVLTTPLCAATALAGTGWTRWVAAAATGLALPALLATESRWAWLGFAVAVGLGIALAAPSAVWRRRLLFALLAGGALFAALNSHVLTRPQSHALIWRDTLFMVGERPWGVGPGQFQLAFLPHASDELLATYPRGAFIVNDAHSEPLQVLAELGWPGLAALALATVLLLRAGRATLEGLGASETQRLLAIAALAGVCGSMVQSLGSPDLRFHVSSLMFGAVAGVAASFAPSAEPRPVRRPGVRALVGLLGLALLATAATTTWSRLSVAALFHPDEPVPAGSAPSEDTVEGLRGLVAERPADGARHYALGVALAGQQRWSEAAECFRQAALLSPGNPNVIRSLGVAQGLAGQFRAAGVHLRAWLADHPEDHELRYLLAYVSWRQGDIATAVEQLEVLLEARPEHRKARLLLEKLRE